MMKKSKRKKSRAKTYTHNPAKKPLLETQKILPTANDPSIVSQINLGKDKQIVAENSSGAKEERDKSMRSDEVATA